MGKKVIAITGGGTAGHIYPALSLASALKEKGYEVIYAGTVSGAESVIVPKQGYEYKSFNVSGFDRQKPWTAISSLEKLLKTKNEAQRWLKDNNVCLVVGFGGYVSVPVVHAAQKLGIKTAIHEQNSVLGLANLELSKKADLICLTYEYAASKLKDGANYVVTGNPVRPEILSAKREDGLKFFKIDPKSKVFLIFGGSLGAKSINEKVAVMKRDLLSHEDWSFIHITGKRDFKEIEKSLNLTKEEKERYKLIDYCNNMECALACANAILCRSGATSLAEISALEIPAILVPFPYATADHQTKNAKEYVEAGAAYLVPDNELDLPIFRDYLFDLLENPNTREKMKKAASGFDTRFAIDNLCKAVCELIE